MATKLSVTLYHWMMNEKLVPFGAKFNFYFCSYWTSSHIMCLKSHWLSGTKITFMEERAIGTFWDQIQFLFFSDRCPLKFLKMECNPTNKKTVALPWLSSFPCFSSVNKLSLFIQLDIITVEKLHSKVCNLNSLNFHAKKGTLKFQISRQKQLT